MGNVQISGKVSGSQKKKPRRQLKRSRATRLGRQGARIEEVESKCKIRLLFQVISERLKPNSLRNLSTSAPENLGPDTIVDCSQ